MTRQAEHEEVAPWGRSRTAWFVVLGVLAVVAVTLVADAVAGAGTLAALCALGGVLRLVLPGAPGLTGRSKAFDASILLFLGVAIAVLAAVVPS